MPLRNLLFLFLAFSHFGTQWTQAQSAQKPLKVAVQVSSHSVGLGDQMEIHCVLLDGNNSPVKAPKDMVVEVDSRLPSGAEKKTPVTIKAGESTYNLTIPASEEGIVEIRAKQKELLGADTFIKVKPSRKPLSMNSIAATNILAARSESMWTGTISPVGAAPGRATTPSRASASAPDTSSEGLGLILKQESRTYLADGKDTATILAFVDGDSDGVIEDLKVFFSDSLGSMVPMPLTIPKGADSGELKLTSDRIGVAKLDYVKSKPSVRLHSEAELLVTFCPPIVGFEVQASPPKISLLEKGELLIRLLDNANKPIDSDVPRQVELSIVTGSGEFETNTVIISANSSSARTIFHPTQRGTVKVSASCVSLMTQVAEIEVTIPVMLLTCALVGGLIGGVVASAVTKDRRDHKTGWIVRTLIGGATGLTFYYFVVLGLLPKIPYSAGINPIGAFILSIIGGWIGTEVFTPILKWVGFLNKTTA